MAVTLVSHVNRVLHGRSFHSTLPVEITDEEYPLYEADVLAGRVTVLDPNPPPAVMPDPFATGQRVKASRQRPPAPGTIEPVVAAVDEGAAPE